MWVQRLPFFLLPLFMSSWVIPQTLSSPVSILLTQLCPSWTSARHPMLEAGKRRMTQEPVVWLASDLGLVLPSLLSCVIEEL